MQSQAAAASFCATLFLCVPGESERGQGITARPAIPHHGLERVLAFAVFFSCFFAVTVSFAACRLDLQQSAGVSSQCQGQESHGIWWSDGDVVAGAPAARTVIQIGAWFGRGQADASERTDFCRRVPVCSSTSRPAAGA